MSVDLSSTAVFVLVTTFTPGPNNILSASLGAMYGYRRALPFLLGVASGFLVLMTLCATLATVLLERFPAVASVLRYVGAAYILWLAVGIYRGSARPPDADDAVAPVGYPGAVALQFVNPKGLFFGLTVYTTFLAPLHDDQLRLAGVTLVLALVCFSAVSTWALAGRLIRTVVRTPARARALGIILAAALVWTAIDLSGVFH